MARNVNFSTGFNTIKIEKPFVIEMVYELLKMHATIDMKKETMNNQPYTPKFRFTLKKEVIKNIRSELINILYYLELILTNTGEEVNLKYLGEYYCQEIDFDGYFSHHLVIFYGSTQQDFINGCWESYAEFDNLFEELNTLIEDKGKTIRFNINADIRDFYRGE